MTKEQKKSALQFSAFMTDLHEVMVKHNVKDMLVVFGMNGHIRNTYLPTEGEKELYCFLSDGIHAWLKDKAGFEAG